MADTRSQQTPIFATREDLEPGLGRIEASRPLKYALCDEYDTPEPQTFSSLTSTDELGVNRFGSAIKAAAYLVVPASEPIHLTFVGPRRFALTQEGNPKSIVFWPSGLYTDECLVAGKIGTVSEDAEAIGLYRDFLRELTRGFKKVRMYFVGPRASQMLQEGKRLVTMHATERPEYDLRG